MSVGNGTSINAPPGFVCCSRTYESYDGVQVDLSRHPTFMIMTTRSHSLVKLVLQPLHEGTPKVVRQIAGCLTDKACEVASSEVEYVA